ncbi:hypothetical protein A2U01_0081318, partial [Trifolium medium]|nr:hypothetical protein [Trifolium medium]
MSGNWKSKEVSALYQRLLTHGVNGVETISAVLNQEGVEKESVETLPMVNREAVEKEGVVVVNEE